VILDIAHIPESDAALSTIEETGDQVICLLEMSRKISSCAGLQ
jgi:hypothetical protein